MGPDLEVYRNLIGLWWKSAKHSEEEIRRQLRQANVKTTEAEIHDALEKWGFLSLPSPVVSPHQSVRHVVVTRPTSSFVDDGLPAFLEMYGSPGGENSEPENLPSSLERFATSQDDSVSWYSDTREPTPSCEEGAVISRKRRITDIVEHVADVLPGISALQSYTREEEDAIIKAWHIQRAKDREKMSSKSRKAVVAVLRRRPDAGKKDGVRPYGLGKGPCEVDEPATKKSRRSSSVASRNSYSSSKRTRRFSISDDDEAAECKKLMRSPGRV